jgi:hypothetical protein
MLLKSLPVHCHTICFFALLNGIDLLLRRWRGFMVELNTLLVIVVAMEYRRAGSNEDNYLKSSGDNVGVEERHYGRILQSSVY